MYSAADVFVLPTIQDNLPNTLIESIACGTPCVAYDVGGVSDIIEHRKNGYLVNSQDVNDLAQGIKWVLEDEKRYKELSGFCRKTTIKKFDINKVAQQYIALYNALV